MKLSVLAAVLVLVGVAPAAANAENDVRTAPLSGFVTASGTWAGDEPYTARRRTTFDKTEIEPGEGFTWTSRLEYASPCLSDSCAQPATSRDETAMTFLRVPAGGTIWRHGGWDSLSGQRIRQPRRRTPSWRTRRRGIELPHDRGHDGRRPRVRDGGLAGRLLPLDGLELVDPVGVSGGRDVGTVAAIAVGEGGCDPIECDDGVDNDGDGLADYEGEKPDTGCFSLTDPDELGPLQCDDGVDNDDDGDADFGEIVDADGDGDENWSGMDVGDDVGCYGPMDDTEGADGDLDADGELDSAATAVRGLQPSATARVSRTTTATTSATSATTGSAASWESGIDSACSSPATSC